MSVVPGNVDTDQQPPMILPLRHFLVGLGFLLLGVLLGAWLTIDPHWGRTLSHVHLLLVGWVCVTIMGAMTQFVPVWSGQPLYSQRLAAWQLPPVAVGLVGFVGSLLGGHLAWTPVFGVAMLAGFWVFVYNVGRTLWRVERLNVTERHFAIALGFFLLVTVLGVLLALDFTVGVFARPLVRPNVVLAHATLAVFGAVLTTVLGALYQLGTMFTQTELHGVDSYLKRVEEVGYPVGVVLLAAGRLVGSGPLARVGGLLVVVGVGCFAVVLVRKLVEMQVEWTPMHRRYAVVAAAMLVWAAVTAPAWVAHPTARATLFGGGPVHLLALGIVGFVVLGTLYHIVPFIIWVHRYSDQLGFQQVPMIDDLYDDRLARLDLVVTLTGTILLTVTGMIPGYPMLYVLSGASLLVGVVLFAGNMLLVVHRHSSHSVRGVLFGDRVTTTEEETTSVRSSD